MLGVGNTFLFIVMLCTSKATMFQLCQDNVGYKNIFIIEPYYD